jgi:hypothetical protein
MKITGDKHLYLGEPRRTPMHKLGDLFSLFTNVSRLA